ncbi:hypothetical protein ASPZODRAFT_1293789 [Penicilliopsis zonata CBS 506.65]|uniref:Uncharacterized protein n=1 Tax=Penicilliopsis zonata CBS 506.65 TaxID=1073090 RepID=A0A1L9S6G1_9EURO|nr:hypothetical protein ASPZODRAFT_1293789 [Penicilliopsis zonata CBS 506.65]OJJ42713.1 hypothetical protein ASPZODRAFT_1293789 [Penicilliopsis zonata CBS 506.65]
MKRQEKKKKSGGGFAPIRPLQQCSRVRAPNPVTDWQILRLSRLYLTLDSRPVLPYFIILGTYIYLVGIY